MIVYLNGQFVAEDRAAVPIDDPGLVYGEGLYETVLIRKGRVPFLEEHWSRLRASAEALEIDVRLTMSGAAEILKELVRRNDLADAIGRFHLTGGGLPLSWPAVAAARLLQPPLPPATVVVRLLSLPEYPPREVLQGWKVVLFELPSPPFLPGVKHTCRLPHLLARRAAARARAQEAILVDPSGVLLEGTRSNLFFVRDGVLYTPALESGILAGVTREKVLVAAGRENLSVNEGIHLVRELGEADEAFLTFTSAGVMPVTDVGGRPVGNGRMGPITRRLRSAYEGVLAIALARDPDGAAAAPARQAFESVERA